MQDIQIDISKLIQQYDATLGELMGRIVQLQVQVETLSEMLGDQAAAEEAAANREILDAFDQ